MQQTKTKEVFMKFPDKLDYVQWIEQQGIRYYNTGYRYDPNETTIWQWTPEGGCKRVSIEVTPLAENLLHLL